MNEIGDKVRVSVRRIKDFEPPEGYYLGFSGGKDSVVCKALCDLVGVKYDAHYNITSVDPPELVRFVKDFGDVSLDIPRDKNGDTITMWKLIERKGTLPTRMVRICCESLKEHGGDGRSVITGVRWAESSKRKGLRGIVDTVDETDKEYLKSKGFTENTKGRLILMNDDGDNRSIAEYCHMSGKMVVNPIVDWTESDVWDFIRQEKIDYCGLYDEGFSRLGCIGCPMAGTKGREKEFARWPKYKDAYMRSIEKLILQKKEKNPYHKWANYSAQDVFNWWMEYPVLPGQISFEELSTDCGDDTDVGYGMMNFGGGRCETD